MINKKNVGVALAYKVRLHRECELRAMFKSELFLFDSPSHAAGKGRH
jgi:hypothetical protein